MAASRGDRDRFRRLYVEPYHCRRLRAATSCAYVKPGFLASALWYSRGEFRKGKITMSLAEKIEKDLVAAMKAQEALKLSVSLVHLNSRPHYRDNSDIPAVFSTALRICFPDIGNR